MDESRFRGPAYETARLKVARLRLDGADSRDKGFSNLTRIAAETLGVVTVRIFMMERGVLESRWSSVSSRPDETGIRLDQSRSPWLTEFLRGCRVASIHDAKRELGGDDFGETYLIARGVASAVCAPIIREGRGVGLICFEHPGDIAWDPGKLTFAASLADLAALILAQAEKLELEAALSARTEMKREGEKLQALVRLSKVVAHDINGLLTILAAVADELPTASSEDLHRRSQDLENVIDVCSRLTEQLFTFSGSVPADDETTDLVACTERLRGPLASRLTTGQALRLDFGELTTARARIDRLSYQRILLNLVSNAVDALSKTGSVWVRVRPPDEQDPLTTGAWVLEVEDDGHGMNETVQSKAIEPYFTTKSEPRGHGLGLSSVLGLAQRVGGGVRIVSAAGRGTRVAVALVRV